MKHLNLKKAVEKFAVVKQFERSGSPSFMAECDGYLITWFTEYYRPDDATCVNVRHVDDKHDLNSDYHAGSYYDTIKSAVRALTYNLRKREEATNV